jgi:peptidoglycan/LPS O-acetylase OafA/YrhL
VVDSPVVQPSVIGSDVELAEQAPKDREVPEREQPKERLYELDLFRFLAAVAVVFYHLLYIGALVDRAPSFPGASEVSRYGYLGVDFFFMLSGFVIIMSVSGRTATKFWKARVVRLFPAYWAAIGVTTLVLGLFSRWPSAKQLLANLTMLQDFLGVEDLDGSYWSLAVELRFYLLIGLVIAVRQIDRIEFLIAGWLGVVALDTVVSLPTWIGEPLITEWAQYFIAGITFALIRSDALVTRFRVSILTVAYLVALLYAEVWTTHLTSTHGNDFDPFVAWAAITMFFAMLAVVALRGFVALRKPRYAILGAVSYPLYLIHQEVGYAVFGNLGMNRWAEFAVTCAVVGSIALLITRFIEPPAARCLRIALQRRH